VDAAGWLHPHDLSLAAVRRAGQRGLHLAILSNAPVEVAEQIDAAPWLAPFTRRFFSCWLRAVKPEPAAYLAVVAGLVAPPHEIIFYDDRPANVAAAVDLGIDARLFENPAQFDQLGNGMGGTPRMG
jgi:putative hydrolase of the HAD superfamily